MCGDKKKLLHVWCYKCWGISTCILLSFKIADINLQLSSGTGWTRRLGSCSRSSGAQQWRSWPSETAGCLLEPKELRIRVLLSRWVLRGTDPKPHTLLSALATDLKKTTTYSWSWCTVRCLPRSGWFSLVFAISALRTVRAVTSMKAGLSLWRWTAAFLFGPLWKDNRAWSFHMQSLPEDQNECH